MLAYLSQQRTMRVERGLLADVLWSDRAEPQARASLRQELSLLRKLLPEDVLTVSRQHVGLEPSWVSIDTSGGGDFLQGFDLQSEAFEDWLRQRRAEAGEEAPSGPGQSATAIFDRPTVLLFAFEAISTGDQDAMIAAGLADDLRTTLSYWRWFPVIGPEAIGWKTGKEVDLRAVATTLGAAYAVTGSLRCLNNRIKISVSLTEVATGLSKWSKSFEGTMDDIFEFQEDVSREIVAQLEPQISMAEATRVARHPPKTLAPWQLIVQADAIERQGGEGYGSQDSNFAQARLMERALQHDPNSARALTRLGRVYFRAGLLDWTDDRTEVFKKSLDYTAEALRIDPDNCEAHAYLGLVQIFGFKDYVSGQFHGSEAVRLNPSAAVARHAYGCGLEWSGQASAAIPHLQLIFRLDPSYNARAAVLGQMTTCLLFVDDREASLDAARKLFALAPGYARGLQRCVSTFGYFGEDALAQKSLELLLRLQPGFDEAYVHETYPYADPVEFEKFITGFRNVNAFSR